MSGLVHALFPTWGDAVAALAWLIVVGLFVAAALRDANDTIDRILDEVFGSGR